MTDRIKGRIIGASMLVFGLFNCNNDNEIQNLVFQDYLSNQNVNITDSTRVEKAREYAKEKSPSNPWYALAAGVGMAIYISSRDRRRKLDNNLQKLK